MNDNLYTKLMVCSFK